jgi:hypothetical protein
LDSKYKGFEIAKGLGGQNLIMHCMVTEECKPGSDKEVFYKFVKRIYWCLTFQAPTNYIFSGIGGLMPADGGLQEMANGS